MPNRKKVLIVDSSPIFRRTLKKVIQTGDVAVDVAETQDADRAVHLVEEHPVDVVFLDIAVPTKRQSAVAEGNGFALIEAIKAIAPDSRVVVLTSLDSVEYENAALEKGADYFLSKELTGTKSMIETFHAALFHSV